MSQPVAVDFGRGVEDAFATVLTFIPKLIAFILILIIGVIVARVLSRLVDTALERVGFDRAVERGGVAQALSRSKYDASDIIAKIVYYAILLLTLIVAFNVFGPNPISTALSGLVSYLPNIVVAIIIVVIAAAIAKAVKDIVGATLGGLSYGNVLATIASTFILALGVIAALNQIGVATTITTPILVAVLATIAGILIVGVGGGMVRPMEQRWDRWLHTAEQEAGNVKQQAQQNRGAARNTLAGYKEQAESYSDSAQSGSGTSAGGSTTYTPTSGSTTYGGSTGSSATTYGGSTGSTGSSGTSGSGGSYGNPSNPSSGGATSI